MTGEADEQHEMVLVDPRPGRRFSGIRVELARAGRDPRARPQRRSAARGHAGSRPQVGHRRATARRHGPHPRAGRAQYTAIAVRIESEVGGIVANCKLEPKADEALHVVIGEIGAGTDAMTGKVAKQRPAQGLVQVANAVNDYAGHFDHPGFKAIRKIQ